MAHSPHEGVPPRFWPVADLIQDEVVRIADKEADNPQVGIGDKGEQDQNAEPLPSMEYQDRVFVLSLVRRAKELTHVEADTVPKNKIYKVVEVDEDPDEKRGYGQSPRFEKSEKRGRNDG